MRTLLATHDKELSVAKSNAQQAVVFILGSLAAACGGGAEPAQSPAGEPEQVEPSSAGAPDEAETSAASDRESGESGDGKQPIKIAGDGSDGPIALNDSDTADLARGVNPSTIEPTKTETAMRFFVVDKAREEAPIPGIVISMVAPDGTKYYTKETDAKGYAEVLVPAGKTYEVEYLSLGRKTITAKVPVPDSPNQNIRLTLRYKRFDAEGKTMVVDGPPPPAVFVLDGVNFDTGKATIRPDSFPRLDRVLEYLKHKPTVRIEISGHTDDVGKPEANKDLSKRRAEACKKYLVDKGIDAGRIDTVGYGSEKPIAPNDTPDGRERNRRIEAKEL